MNLFRTVVRAGGNPLFYPGEAPQIESHKLYRLGRDLTR